MRKIVSLRGVMAAGGFFFGAGLSAPSLAQDPVAVSPEIYRVVFENEAIRVLSVVIGPGQRDEPHSHPRYLVFVQDPGLLRVHPDEGGATEMALTPGQIELLEPVTRHWGENIGETVVRLTAIEFKQ